jgi:hypothetical protein
MTIKTRILLASLALVGFTACGGRSGTITVQVVTSPTQDPFANAAQVRVYAGNMMTVTTAPVSGGHFTLDFPEMPGNGSTQITVEALDSANNIIAWGRTPLVLTQPVDQGPYKVWVAPPTTVLTAASSFSAPRTEFAAANINGLGVLFAGGRDSNGTTLNLASVYDVYTQSILDVATMNQVRAGAAAVQVAGIRAVVYGGAQSNGLGTTGTELSGAELFDPSQGTGLWAPINAVPPAMPLATAFAPSTVVSNTLVVADGFGPQHNPLNGTVMITTDTSPMIVPVTAAMATPRGAAALSSTTFPEGEGAIIFGGLAAANTTGPVAERLIGQTWTDYSMNMPANRNGATATRLPDNRVLVVGGSNASGPTRDGFIIAPTVPATVTPLPNVLSVARDGHTATLVGSDVIVCNGADGSGALQASCDLLNATTGAFEATIPTPIGRKGGTATLTELSLVVLAGGVGPDGNPLAEIDLYTPVEPPPMPTSM